MSRPVHIIQQAFHEIIYHLPTYCINSVPFRVAIMLRRWAPFPLYQTFCLLPTILAGCCPTSSSSPASSCSLFALAVSVPDRSGQIILQQYIFSLHTHHALLYPSTCSPLYSHVCSHHRGAPLQADRSGRGILHRSITSLHTHHALLYAPSSQPPAPTTGNRFGDSHPAVSCAPPPSLSDCFFGHPSSPSVVLCCSL